MLQGSLMEWFCMYSMKYVLSSGNELWCGVVGEKVG